MIKWPTKLAGINSKQRWLNLLLSAVKSAEIVEGKDYRLQRTTRGTQIVFEPGGGASGGKYDFILCRNGEQIRVKLVSNVDPTTVEPDTGEEDPPAP